jgi:cytochrome c
MRPIHHDLMPTIVQVSVVAGLMGLEFSSILHAQDYPTDITRGEDLYRRHCQACTVLGGLGDGPEANSPLFVLPEVR